MRAHHFTLAVFIVAITFAARLLADPPREVVRAAAVKGLTILQKGAAGYMTQKKCFSCHHQALPVLAMTTAKMHGFEINEEELQRQVKFTAEFLSKNKENYEKGKGQGGQADTAGYALLTLHAGGWKADDTTAAVVSYLLQRDKDREFWKTTSNRPPTEASPFTTTYLALAGLKNFGPGSKWEDIDTRKRKARVWMLRNQPKDTEDRVFQLQAFKLLDVADKYLLAATEELIKQQRKDGGWSQLAKLDSDAYATGSVLVALHQAGGLPVKDEGYQRGLEFLLKNQRADGSWHIKTRSNPFQTYFESGFPHGKDQWISSAGTSWATIALALACQP
jgi:hypothetical protein